MKRFVEWLFDHPSAVRIIIGLLRLRGVVFSRSRGAEVVGVSRSTYFELFPGLVEFGVVVEVKSVGRPLYRLNEGHPLVRVLLELLEGGEGE